MKALVTGGGGFLGRYIVQQLLDRGDQVRVLGRRDYPDLRAKGVEVVQADISNKTAVMAATSTMDAVFHVAGLAAIWGRWDDFLATNVEGTKNVIEACKANGVTKLVYTSSPSVVFDGRAQINVDESAKYPERFIAFYPKSKAMAEQAVLSANGQDGLMTVALRPHLIWGPGDTNLIPRLVDRAKHDRVKVVGNRKNMISTIYVENAAEAHLLACDRLEPGSPVPGSPYFITQGEPVNCWDWIDELLKGFGLPPVQDSVSFTAAYRAGVFLEGLYYIFRISSEPRMTRFLACQLAKSHTYSNVKAKNELGFMPKISMQEGMNRLFKAGHRPKHG